MKIIIKNSSDTPLYQQIIDQMIGQILKGEIESGEMLPSIRNFANELKVSVLTIRRAYKELEEMGYIETRAGLGSFIKTTDIENLYEKKLTLAEEKLQNAIYEVKKLGIKKEDVIEIVEIFYEEEI